MFATRPFRRHIPRVSSYGTADEGHAGKPDHFGVTFFACRIRAGSTFDPGRAQSSLHRSRGRRATRQAGAPRSRPIFPVEESEMRHRKTTFREILTASAAANSERVVERARLASHAANYRIAR